MVSHILFCFLPLQLRHNEHDGVSNLQPHDCLLNRLFVCRSRKSSKLRVTDLCAGNSPVTVEFPAQMASYAENFSIWWRHHANQFITCMHKPTENNQRSLISPFSSKNGLFWPGILTSPHLICDVTQKQVIGVVRSYLSILLACVNWLHVDLH